MLIKRLTGRWTERLYSSGLLDCLPMILVEVWITYTLISHNSYIYLNTFHIILHNSLSIISNYSAYLTHITFKLNTLDTPNNEPKSDADRLKTGLSFSVTAANPIVSILCVFAPFYLPITIYHAANC